MLHLLEWMNAVRILQRPFSYSMSGISPFMLLHVVVFRCLVDICAGSVHICPRSAFVVSATLDIANTCI